MEKEHALVPEYVPDGRAGLIVSRSVGQFVIAAETFSAGHGPDATLNINHLAYHIVPDPVDRIDIFLVTGQRCHIGHPGIEIRGADGMSFGHVLLGYRLVILPVLAVLPLIPALGIIGSF